MQPYLAIQIAEEWQRIHDQVRALLVVQSTNKPNDGEIGLQWQPHLALQSSFAGSLA